MILKERLYIKSMSKTIVKILEEMIPYIEKHEISFTDKEAVTNMSGMRKNTENIFMRTYRNNFIKD